MSNIWTTDTYIYRATTSGLAIHDYSTEALITFVPMPASSVWADNQYIYVGTTTSGVLRSVTSGTISFTTYKEYPNITSNTVNYIHGAGNYICIATESGIDRYNISTDDRATNFAAGPKKCFQTTAGDYYYVVNQEDPVYGLEDNVFNWKYAKEITLSHPVPEDDYQLKVEVPTSFPYEVYTYAMNNGEDVRFLDDNLNVVPHYRETWDYVSNPVFWVKLSADVEKIYLLYGNSFAGDTSSQVDTFRLFDDFDAAELSSLWEFSNGGYAPNTYTISNGEILLHAHSANFTVYLKSVESFTGGTIDFRAHKVFASGYTYDTDLDFYAGFESGAQIYIGCSSQTAEFPHRLISNSTQGIIEGTKYMSTSLADFSIFSGENHQESYYDGETLVSSGTQTMVASKLTFHLSNTYYQPNVSIDWIRLRSYDPVTMEITYGAATELKNKLQGGKLEAVYDSGGSYSYTNTGLLEADFINDIYVTEDSSQHGGNVLFLATSYGAMVIEEKRGDEANSEKLIYLLGS
jgi:hypothetical protein